MMLLSYRTHAKFADRRGFVMPMTLFALMIMGTMAVVAINVSVNEHRSSRAVRTSLEALLAGITGLNEIQADWNDTLATLPGQLDTLSSGGTIQIGWTNLASGASYKGEVMRIDNGGQELFLVTVDGRDGSGLYSERAVTAILTRTGELTLGGCCAAAATVRGETKLKTITGLGGTLSGIDINPPGWDAATCDGVTLEDKPGVIAANQNDVSAAAGTTLEGDPAGIVEDPTMADSTFDDYGGETWDEVKAKANHIIGEVGVQYKLNKKPPGDPLAPLGPLGPNGLPTDANDNWVGPRYTDVGGTLVCNTAHPLNWGSEDPTDPCYDYYPVILFRGEIELKNSMYGQGIFMLDANNGTGSELELEGCSYGSPWTGPIPPCTGIELAGIIIGRGCVEIQYESSFYGSIFVDGSYPQESCGSDRPLSIDRNGSAQYSSCVVQRALEKSGIGQISGGGSVVQKLGSRWFAELIR